MLDTLGGAHMTQGFNTTFDADRHGNPNASLALNGGFTLVPPNVYFNTGFTISAWVNPRQVGQMARLIDFGNSATSDNIVVALSYTATDVRPLIYVFKSAQMVAQAISLNFINANSWSFITATFDGTCAKMYLNGAMSSQATLIPYTELNNVVRNNNYIGQSNWFGDGYSNSLIDDLRIYSRCLNNQEILELMNF